MRMYAVSDSACENYYGPFSDPVLADKVLKIVQMSQDEEATIESMEMDEYAEELRAGLLPFKITIEIDPSNGVVIKSDVFLHWPPEKKEGPILCNDTYREYFVWEKTPGAAKVKATRFKIPKEVADPERETATGSLPTLDEEGAEEMI